MRTAQMLDKVVCVFEDAWKALMEELAHAQSKVVGAVRLECGALFLAHGSALVRKGDSGRVREVSQILGVATAQVPLGVHVALAHECHGVGKPKLGE